jgi:hypothetical protein
MHGSFKQRWQEPSAETSETSETSGSDHGFYRGKMEKGAVGGFFHL